MDATAELLPGARLHRLSEAYRYLRIATLDSSNHVVIVALHRPRKRNALNSTMWKELGQLFGGNSDLSLMSAIPECRVVLLHGSGSDFCAGIDLTDPNFHMTQDTECVAHRGLAFLPKLQEMQRCLTVIEDCPVPVVAAVHGNCIGAGIDLLCCTQIAVATRDAKFSIREVQLGLAADVGTLQRLPKRSEGTSSLVNELCFTGNNFSAEVAVRLGLLSRVVDDQRQLFESAMELCRIIASHSPVAVRGTKKALFYARDHAVSDGLEQIASHNALALQSRDLQSAWMHTASRRKGRVRYLDIPAHSKL